ncbi:hypothetical protein VUR80DRAFT_6909 [Thermomyces stellatus]
MNRNGGGPELGNGDANFHRSSISLIQPIRAGAAGASLRRNGGTGAGLPWELREAIAGGCYADPDFTTSMGTD